MTNAATCTIILVLVTVFLVSVSPAGQGQEVVEWVWPLVEYEHSQSTVSVEALETAYPVQGVPKHGQVVDVLEDVVRREIGQQEQSLYEKKVPRDPHTTGHSHRQDAVRTGPLAH